MARFLNGHNPDIQDIVEMQSYIELNDMVHQAIKVEAQLKRKGSTRRTPTITNSPWRNTVGSSSSSWKTLAKSEPKERASKVKRQESAPMPKAEVTPRSREVQCFKCRGLGHISSQCLNKKAMVINTMGDLESREKKS